MSRDPDADYEYLVERLEIVDMQLKRFEGRLSRVEMNAPRNNSFSDREESDGRAFRCEAKGAGPCNGCGTYATLRTLEIATDGHPARKGVPACPPGWCPLIALCGACWTKVVAMLRAKATPDMSGAVSP